jgi:hypothetical protein
MKTLKATIETFSSEALKRTEMNYLLGGGDPIDLTIPPKGYN